MIRGVVVLLCLASGVLAETGCEPPKFLECVEPIHNATTGHPHGLFQNAGDLYSSCPILKNGAECITSYSARCGTDLIAENFNDQFERPLKLIAEICNLESPLRAEYLSVSPCLLKNADELSECSLKVQEFLSNFVAETDEEEKTMACMYESMFRSCVMSSATNLCGVSAGNVLRKALQYAPASGMKLCFDKEPL